MKNLITSLLLIITSVASAQKNKGHTIKPRYTIHLTTVQGNTLKGLLLQVNDTTIIIYPGKRKEWNRGEEYYPVVFACSNVRKIKLKKKNSVAKGMLLGGGVGLSAVFASVMLNKATAKSEAVSNAVLIVPAGVIGGAYMGSKSKKNFYINGNKTAFTEFQKQIK